MTTRICYAAVFGDGVSRAELIRRSRDDPIRIDAVLAGLVKQGKVERRAGRYWLRPAVASAAARRERRALARQIVGENRGIVRVVCTLPFVRVLAISGSVAYSRPRGTNHRAPDLDFFVITSAHTLHLVRLPLLLLLRLERLLPIRWSSKRFRPCFNYFLDGSRLALVNESFYTATDALSARVLKGRATYRRFLHHNEWIQRYYATADGADAGEDLDRPGPGRRWFLPALNACAFLFHWGVSWIKRQFVRVPEGFGLGEDPSRGVTLRRAWPAGGGYQVDIFRRFQALYRDHFPELSSPAYLEFLFPGTTPSGIWLAGRFLSGPPARELGLVE